MFCVEYLIEHNPTFLKRSSEHSIDSIKCSQSENFAKVSHILPQKNLKLIFSMFFCGEVTKARRKKKQISYSQADHKGWGGQTPKP